MIDSDDICCCCFDYIKEYKCKQCTYSFCNSCYQKLRNYRECVVCKYVDNNELRNTWIIKINGGNILNLNSIEFNNFLSRIQVNRPINNIQNNIVESDYENRENFININSINFFKKDCVVFLLIFIFVLIKGLIISTIYFILRNMFVNNLKYLKFIDTNTLINNLYKSLIYGFIVLICTLITLSQFRYLYISFIKKILYFIEYRRLNINITFIKYFIKLFFFLFIEILGTESFRIIYSWERNK